MLGSNRLMLILLCTRNIFPIYRNFCRHCLPHILIRTRTEPWVKCSAAQQQCDYKSFAKGREKASAWSELVENFLVNIIKRLSSLKLLRYFHAMFWLCVCIHSHSKRCHVNIELSVLFSMLALRRARRWRGVANKHSHLLQTHKIIIT